MAVAPSAMATSRTLSPGVGSPLQLGAAEMFSGGAVSKALPPAPHLKRQSPGVVVVNSMSSSSQGSIWLIGQCSNFQQQLGLLAARSTSTPYNCQRGIGVASISKIFIFGTGGGGKGFGGWGRGGGNGGGDGGGGEHGVPAAIESSIGVPDGDEESTSITEDVIFLNVAGMSCGGCSGKVKKILEAQPQVIEATVDLATATAVVQVVSEPVAASGWEDIKRQLGESLAKHLTSCGFNSSLREQGEIGDINVAPAASHD